VNLFFLYRLSFLAALYVFIDVQAIGQPLVLKANGPGDTYELINSVLAPGYDVVEHPECVHGAFGRHIAEVWDNDLNDYVFEFYSHVTQDNDRCINFDRQRVEIKTYDKSPDSLIGTRGETITYKWLFRIPSGFKASSNFTHIHQIKPVNGDDGDPIFTLTVRKGNPNKMELIHNNTNKVSVVNLSLFEGEWVEATEVVKVGANGTYSMVIRRIRDNATLISYANSNLMTIRADNDFIRPKWGIYRSLLNAQDLRDDAIRFNRFSIEEGEKALPVGLSDFKAILNKNVVEISWITLSEQNNHSFSIERSENGTQFHEIGVKKAVGNSNAKQQYYFSDIKPITGKNYYRLKQVDFSGQSSFSNIILISFFHQSETGLHIFPNPVQNYLQIQLQPDHLTYHASVVNIYGQSIIKSSGTTQVLSKSISAKLGQLGKGMYMLHILGKETVFSCGFYKN
jgi:Secretion system C-terminal sorting domain